MSVSDRAFPKRARLLKPAEFAEVRRNGKRICAGCIAVSAVSGRTRRLGIAVSKRVGNSVTRNRIKRVIRELFRQGRDSFPAGDTVVVALPGAAELENWKIREDLSKALARAASKF